MARSLASGGLLLGRAPRPESLNRQWIRTMPFQGRVRAIAFQGGDGRMVFFRRRAARRLETTAPWPPAVYSWFALRELKSYIGNGSVPCPSKGVFVPSPFKAVTDEWRF